MRGYVTEFNIYLTDDESKLLENAIHQYLINLGWKALFDGMEVAGITTNLVNIYSKLVDPDFTLNRVTAYDINNILRVLRTVRKDFPMASIDNLIDDFARLDHVHCN